MRRKDGACAAFQAQRLLDGLVDRANPIGRRLAGVIGIVDPEAVQHQPVGQRMDLGRTNLQALAGQGPGQLVEDARGNRFGRSHGDLQGGRVGLVAGRRPHAAGLQVVQQPQVGGRLLDGRGTQVAGGQGVDVPREPGFVGLVR